MAVVLSTRQREALQWAARGKTLGETAMILGVAAGTVRIHWDNARAKLDAANITQCVAKALKVGVLDFADVMRARAGSRAHRGPPRPVEPSKGVRPNPNPQARAATQAQVHFQ
jgi:DNA-binding CsgD family transcriptional regulator